MTKADPGGIADIPPCSVGAHSWGHDDGSGMGLHQITFVDDADGLLVVILHHAPTHVEAEYMIPVELVSSLIRHLIRFSTTGEIAKWWQGGEEKSDG